ncbi:MAG: ribonucleotide-diphosphate reductase subunit beta [Alphaproteobacteria bacterium]|nr:ribonucleotide-diphosphate reductase subunit beta [Alphaproteobacteria bacterium]MBU0799199.1 ribonucleotide-diphosphate reductase subunit beta [Alphaproteobacteria bacterium]MBU0887550.1 ribonucleotide-diphosphate reductase subunit beta [Alphaproteobacteria bacterium]MBU1814787.1 ribonucleotide-diphosphate reductase subunit beta [Alphaproteobacteria bacterium]MBU2090805.1 ribonucleotide-diphosphate reductase subunit beta [Alphaproteobacteria bacterium]
MSIIGIGHIDPRELIGTGKVGLLTSTGTYDVNRYSWAYDYWKRQQQTHWMGEEVPLGGDIKDWASDRVSDSERALLTQIFRFFTQSDVEVGDNYLKRYIPIFQPLELQMMMAAFSNMETVHIDAYALLLKTLGMPQSEFEAFRDYGEMRAKADYMHTFGVGTVSDVARTLAMFGAFTEGMSLFASFAMLLNFPRHNKMNGMGQIVSWSVRDESLHCEGIVRLYHEWHRETGAVTAAVRDDIIDVAKTMVRLEERFIDLAFGLGQIEGMTGDDIKSYVRYIADWRLTQLKLPTVFGYFEQTDTGYQQLRPHPLPWLVEILNGVEHANFFEQRATEYSKGASRGSWDGEEGVWAMFEKQGVARQSAL